jgi:hypothetical protein
MDPTLETLSPSFRRHLLATNRERKSESSVLGH